MPIDIILITCNRLPITKETIEELHKRIKVPFRLIVVDDMSVDGTAEYLIDMKRMDVVDVFEQLDNSNICQAYNKGFEFVESDYFICMQDDITVPDLEPCVTEQLIGLMKKHPENASIGCRIQRIPNLNWREGNEDLLPARKAASAYFRIHRKSDIDKLGDKPFGDRNWDDIAWVEKCRKVLKMECSWAKNLWADHSRGYCLDRGYLTKPRKWGTGIHSRTRQAHIEKPYPTIDPKTNIPLHILNADKKTSHEINPDKNYFGYNMRTRAKYYDDKILKSELNPVENMYRLPDDIKVMIDVGAHIGGTSIRVASKGAIVFSFEPELFNYEMLVYNVRKNRLRENIHHFNLGVGKPGRAELFIHKSMSGTTSSYIDQFKGEERDIPSQIASFISIKDVFNNYDIDHCDILKLDCEGSEEDIINDFDDDLANKIDQISLEFHKKAIIQQLVDKLSKWYVPENIRRCEWVFRKKV